MEGLCFGSYSSTDYSMFRFGKYYPFNLMTFEAGFDSHTYSASCCSVIGLVTPCSCHFEGDFRLKTYFEKEKSRVNF